MKEKLVISFYTFFLLADFFFLEYYFTVRFGILLFALMLIVTTRYSHEKELLNGLSKYYLLIWELCIIHLGLIYILESSAFMAIQIPRAISMLFQTFIVYLFSYALFLRYGAKALQISCLSFIFAYIICIVQGIIYLGPIGLIQYAFDFSDSKVAAESIELNRMFEIHSLGLTFPLFILAHFVYKKVCKSDLFSKRVILLLVFFTLLSLKRISIGAAVTIYVTFVLTYNSLNLKKINNAAIFVFFVYSIIVLYIVYNPLFFDYIQANNINLMGREYLYRGVTTETSLSIDYIGKGWSWVSAYMKFESQHSNIFNGILGLHNDILKNYVELGFIGFVLLYIIQYHLTTKYLSNKSLFLAYLYVIFQAFALITYMTDNTSQYWDFQTVLIIMPLCLYYSIMNKNSRQKQTKASD